MLSIEFTTVRGLLHSPFGLSLQTISLENQFLRALMTEMSLVTMAHGQHSTPHKAAVVRNFLEG